MARILGSVHRLSSFRFPDITENPVDHVVIAGFCFSRTLFRRTALTAKPGGSLCVKSSGRPAL